MEDFGAHRTQNDGRWEQNTVPSVSVHRSRLSRLGLKCFECAPGHGGHGRAGTLVRVSGMHEIALNLCFWAGRVADVFIRACAAR